MPFVCLCDMCRYVCLFALVTHTLSQLNCVSHILWMCEWCSSDTMDTAQRVQKRKKCTTPTKYTRRNDRKKTTNIKIKETPAGKKIYHEFIFTFCTVVLLVSYCLFYGFTLISNMCCALAHRERVSAPLRSFRLLYFAFRLCMCFKMNAHIFTRPTFYLLCYSIFFCSFCTVALSIYLFSIFFFHSV